ncbi:MAG: NAD(P)/FAD-dependent oxidoreductase [Firmicutes bacterium]|nr:NAD(P)/FAD-dependent oxidoreductase [Bacillota bacterium]
MYDVAIIGAGVIGSMVARELARYQLSVVVLEGAHDVAMGTTKANSAIVHAGFDAVVGTLKAKLNVAGSEAMEEVCRELGVKYQRNGSLVVAYRPQDMEKVRELYDRGQKNGVRGLEVIGQEELRKMEPAISEEAVGALYAPTGAIVCPYELNIASIGNAMDNGVELKVEYKVTSIEKKDDAYEISNGTEKVQARFVVNAAGMYADHVAAMVGDTSFSLYPRKGQYMLLDHDCVGSITHTLFNVPNELGKGILVSPTVDQNLLLGPTAENQEDREDMATTAEGLQMVQTNALKVVPSVNLRGVITAFAGLRAVGSTGDFILTSPMKGFWNAAGIESPGLSSAPAIAKYLVNGMAKQGLELVEKADFNPIRPALHDFSKMSIEEKNEMIRKNPLYGHIICRCESISEGEIVDAIRQNPPARDIDGVKRRTRAGMGRCQGGFCGPMVTEILAKEMQIPMEQVTKFGGGSYMNVGRTREEQSHEKD